MGHSFYDKAVTTSYLARCASTGEDTFSHTAAINQGEIAREVHKNLRPDRKNTAGLIVRESRDSAEHPNSRAIAILFDVTGSMHAAPRIFLEKLPNLMQLLVRKGIVSNPHILFGAIGDATAGDLGPLQIGQFEAGNEMDSDLTNVWLEGGGGWPLPEESYELGIYFLAQYAEMDCLTKRNQKGYCFILGDERPHKTVSASILERLTGERPQADVPTADVLAKLREKFNVFWIMPGGTLHENDEKVLGPLKEMFGQQFIKLKHPKDVCEVISTIIGVSEGVDISQVASDLSEAGADHAAIQEATSAISGYAATVPSTAGGVVVEGTVPAADPELAAADATLNTSGE